MGKLDAAERVPVETIAEWRDWLTANSESSDGVWIVLWRPVTGRARITYTEAILEALCVGWVDGQSRPLDGERSMLWFAPRSPTSPWSGTNKSRAAMLIEQGRMRPAGQRLIDLAQQSGTWTMLDGPNAGTEPPELTAALDASPSARSNWDAFPPSARRLALTAIAMAKRPETRAARVAKIVTDAAEGRRPR